MRVGADGPTSCHQLANLVPCGTRGLTGPNGRLPASLKVPRVDEQVSRKAVLFHEREHLCGDAAHRVVDINHQWAGWQGNARRAKVEVNGQIEWRSYPKSEKISTIQNWQAETKVHLRRTPVAKSRGTLRDDVAIYLRGLDRDLVSYKDREKHLHDWADAFGDIRTTLLLKRVGDLNMQLKRWRQTLSASSCNHRRDALTALVKVLYGKREWRELADDLMRFRPEDPTSRAVPLPAIDAALAQIDPNGLTYPRLVMMRWTGMRPSQMARLTPESFRLLDDPPHVVVPRGKRGRLVRVPLLGPGLDNAHVFLTRTHRGRTCFGSWSCPSANRRLLESCEKAGVEKFTVYALRHSVAARLRETGTPMSDIRALLGHSSELMTERYAPPVLEGLADGVKNLV